MEGYPWIPPLQIWVSHCATEYSMGIQK